MYFQLIFLTIALSIDALGIGMSYGLRKIKLKALSIFIISLISLVFSSISVSIGGAISSVFTSKITSLVSIFILIMLGLFVIKKGLEKSTPKPICPKYFDKYCTNLTNKNICCTAIKSIGIMINSIKIPSNCDLDNSKIIDTKEAIYLGILLSVDSLGVGITLHSFGFLFPLFIVLFQLLFLCSGIFLGKKTSFQSLDETKISVLSGSILIIIGALRIITS